MYYTLNPMGRLIDLLIGVSVVSGIWLLVERSSDVTKTVTLFLGLTEEVRSIFS